MTQAIIYMQENGIPAFILPSEESLQKFPIEELSAQLVPTGKNYKIVEISKLPLHVSQERWVISESDLDNEVDDGLFNISVSDAYPITKKYLPLEFLELFTEQEQLDVVAATMTSTPVKLWYDKMLAASYVDLADDRTSEGMAALVAAGLITQPRADEILNAS